MLCEPLSHPDVLTGWWIAVGKSFSFCHVAFRLRHIPCPLLKYPVQAVRVLLAGFRPASDDKNVERIPYSPEWSLKALWTMVDCVEGKRLSASILVRNAFFFPPLLVLAEPKILTSTLIYKYLFYCESS